MRKLLHDEGLSYGFFPDRKVKGCMMHTQNSYIVGPECEIYKCWNDVSDEGKVIGHIQDGILHITNSSRYIKYRTQTSAFNSECKECHAFPICDGGCGSYRYRNVFENSKFILCSPYRDLTVLKDALLHGEFSNLINGENQT